MGLEPRPHVPLLRRNSCFQMCNEYKRQLKAEILSSVCSTLVVRQSCTKSKSNIGKFGFIAVFLDKPVRCSRRSLSRNRTRQKRV
jgi:hypothetical protein